VFQFLIWMFLERNIALCIEHKTGLQVSRHDRDSGQIPMPDMRHRVSRSARRSAAAGGPLKNREGKFALKYFRVSDGAHLRKNGRTSRFG